VIKVFVTHERVPVGLETYEVVFEEIGVIEA
jgi:hypothetical protein